MAASEPIAVTVAGGPFTRGSGGHGFCLVSGQM